MTETQHAPNEEPTITVGLVEKIDSISVRLLNDFMDVSGGAYPAGEYQVECLDRNGKMARLNWKWIRQQNKLAEADAMLCRRHVFNTEETRTFSDRNGIDLRIR